MLSGLVMAGLLLTGCSAGEQETTKPTPASPVPGVEVFTGLSNAHLKKGEYPQSYPQSPPVGGPHSPRWLACGVYASAVPKENAVHSIEHGAIWLTYTPDLTPAGVASLAEFTKLSPEYVLVSPYSGQDHVLIATTWGLQLRVDSADDPRLVAFIKAHAGGDQGGEPGVGCAKGGASLEQATEFNTSQR